MFESEETNKKREKRREREQKCCVNKIKGGAREDLSYFFVVFHISNAKRKSREEKEKNKNQII